MQKNGVDASRDLVKYPPKPGCVVAFVNYGMTSVGLGISGMDRGWEYMKNSDFIFGSRF